MEVIQHSQRQITSSKHHQTYYSELDWRDGHRGAATATTEPHYDDFGAVDADGLKLTDHRMIAEPPAVRPRGSYLLDRNEDAAALARLHRLRREFFDKNYYDFQNSRERRSSLTRFCGDEPSLDARGQLSATDTRLLDASSRLSGNFTNLDPLDAYYFRVRAANCAGFGATSASTPPIRPPMPPGIAVDENAPAQPNRPVMVELDGDRATVEWHVPTSAAVPLGGAEVVGYIVEYRPANASAWLQSNDYPVTGPKHQVGNLRPNGDYEFRVTARDADGRLSMPSASSGVVRIRPAVPMRADELLSAWRGRESANYDSALTVPGPPKAILLNSDAVRLEWESSCLADSTAEPIGYLVEARQLFSGDGGDDDADDRGISLCAAAAKRSEWYVVAPRRVDDPSAGPAQKIAVDFPTQSVYVDFPVDNLRPDADYEFRVSAVALQSGRHSASSAPSEIVRLRSREGCASTAAASDPTQKPPQRPPPRSQPPERPVRPEYLDFDGGNSVTLCWIPAKSVLPVLGYEVEFRDQMQDATRWYKLTDQLVRSCKTTVGYLIHGHQYQFRILAKNAVGHSPPSDPSPLITIGASLKDAKYVEAERHAAVALLQDEMIRESPPLPDRDDSPPPIYCQTGASSLQWRDPTLKEVIDYLQSGDPLMVENASGYLQHLTFNNDAIKEDTRNYGGIPNLVALLEGSDNVEILRNACGTLKNLAFGRNNDANKKEINACGGVRALARVMARSGDIHVLEEASGALWNLSSCDELKEPVLNYAAGAVVSAAVVPFSDIGGGATGGSRAAHVVFRNGVGTLRNVSAVNATARKLLRDQPRLIDALLVSLSAAVERNDLDNRTVENCVGLLRNLSYRVQEVVDPKYDPSSRNSRHNNSSLRQQADQSAVAAAASTTTNSGALRGGSRERSRSAPHSTAAQSPRSRKLLFKKSKMVNGDSGGSGSTPQSANPPLLLASGKSVGAHRLWHPETIRVYLRILLQCTSMEILEATAAAIQNLAACSFDGGRIVRETVRLENGLPILGELLKLSDDRVVCAMVNALRNLAFDAQNLELIFENAMPELVAKLPRADQTPGRRAGADDGAPIGDSTISAVLGILWEAMRQSADRTRKFHRAGGTARLQALSRAYPAYGMRVCKYATQVLYTMWQHRELHEMFRRDGMRDADFFAGTLSRGKKSTAGGATTASPAAMAHDTATLGRAISTQGPERPMHLLDAGEPTEPLFNYDDCDDGARDEQQRSRMLAAQNGRFTVSQTLPSPAGIRSQHSATNNVAMTNGGGGGKEVTKAEPLYASVHKRNGVDSWV